jgi:mitochondrial cardiolipin hydrolase
MSEEQAQRLLAQLAESFADGRLDDAEKNILGELAAASDEELRRRLRNRAFDLVRAASDETASVYAFAHLKWLEGVVRALDRQGDRAPVRSHVAFSPGRACLETVLQHLRQVRRQADLCVFTISDDRIAEAVLDAHRRGIAIRLITDNAKEFDVGSDVGRLREAGIAVVVDRSEAHMHHKFALFDGHWLINGSYNWTRSASEANEENLVASNDPDLYGQFAARFEKLWRQLSA